MARNRMIKKEVLEDSKIGKLSDTAKWLFIGLWIIADDEGFLQNDIDWIKIKCFPYNPQIDIKKVLKELFDLHLINENNGIIKILNFLKHQTINRPAESDLCTIYRQNSMNNHGTINEDSHLNIIEVKEKLKENKENINKKEVKEKEYMSDFEKFWQIYPKQRAGSKEKAYKAFIKAITEKRATAEKIIESCRNYAICDEVVKGFAKGCQAWLNDDRFNDKYVKKYVDKNGAEELVQKIANGDFDE